MNEFGGEKVDSGKKRAKGGEKNFWNPAKRATGLLKRGRSLRKRRDSAFKEEEEFLASPQRSRWGPVAGGGGKRRHLVVEIVLRVLKTFMKRGREKKVSTRGRGRSPEKKTALMRNPKRQNAAKENTLPHRE